MDSWPDETITLILSLCLVYIEALHKGIGIAKHALFSKI